MLLLLFFSMSTILYRCSQCLFKGQKKNAICHFTAKHAPVDRVPYRCNTCNFKAVTLGKWKRHLRQDLNQQHTCIKSINPYDVSIGVNMDITEIPVNVPKLPLNNISPSPSNISTSINSVTNNGDYTIEISEDIVEILVDTRDEKNN